MAPNAREAVVRKPKEPKVALELRFDDAATPARVAVTAHFIDVVLKAAAPHLPPDSVTVVVSNRSTVAGIRAWDSSGTEAVGRWERLLRNPKREVGLDPFARGLAAATAKAIEPMLPYRARVVKPRAKRAIAMLNERLVSTLEASATLPTATTGPEPPIAGSTCIFTPIYRIGRTDEGTEVKARIRVEDQARDLPIDPSAIGAAFDVAKGGVTVPVDVTGLWERDAGNGLVLDWSRARITRIGAEWRPVAGAEFLDTIHQEIPDAFADFDVNAVAEEIH